MQWFIRRDVRQELAHWERVDVDHMVPAAVAACRSACRESYKHVSWPQLCVTACAEPLPCQTHNQQSTIKCGTPGMGHSRS